jgi:hypothetical protein
MEFKIEKELTTIPNINALLSDQERQARRMLMDKIIEDGRPVYPSDYTGDKLIQCLDSKGVIARNGDGLVTVVYPVSAMPTPHKVKLKDGRSFYSICAIDSLGSAFAFEQDITVTSSCSYCHRQVYVAIENGEISSFDPEGVLVTHTDLAGEVNWAGTC